MPFLVKAEVKNSSIHGKGVYALEKIPKGTVQWVYEHETEGIPVLGYEGLPNEHFSEDTFPVTKSVEEIKEILQGGFLYQGGPYFIYLRDGSQFTNHSINCTSQLIYPPDGNFRKCYTVSLRDIEPGEEFTENYQQFLSNVDWIEKLMKKYCPDRHEYEEEVKHEKEK